MSAATPNPPLRINARPRGRTATREDRARAVLTADAQAKPGRLHRSRLTASLERGIQPGLAPFRLCRTGYCATPRAGCALLNNMC
jgi:hypothetical protein